MDLAVLFLRALVGSFDCSVSMDDLFIGLTYFVLLDGLGGFVLALL